MKNKMFNKVAASLTAGATALVPFAAAIAPVQAAGVSVTLTSSEVAVSTGVDVSLAYTASAALSAGDTIRVYYDDAGYDQTALVGGDVSISAGGSALTGGTMNVATAGEILYTLGGADSVSSSDAMVIAVGSGADDILTEATPGNYAWTVVTDPDGANGDFGSALQYVGDDNDVTVTATVTPTLSFVIRTSDDTADTNECDLGALTTTALASCQYRLKVTTNADNGFSMTIDTDGDLRKSGSGDVGSSEDIAPIAAGDVAAGTEGYGVRFWDDSAGDDVVNDDDADKAPGTVTAGSITLSGDFGTDHAASNDSDLPINSATGLLSADGPNNPSANDTANTTLVTHVAAIDAAVETGAYAHTVTYTVTPSF